MATASCPCDGCEYEGEPSSVEAHVSACTDESHKGKVGREFRREIRGEDAETVADPLQVIDEAATNEATELDAEDDEAAESDESDEEVAEEVDGSDVPAEAAAAGAAVGGGSLLMESDWDVSGTTVAAGVAVTVALILAWMYLRDSSSETAPEADDEPEENDAGGLGGDDLGGMLE